MSHARTMNNSVTKLETIGAVENKSGLYEAMTSIKSKKGTKTVKAGQSKKIAPTALPKSNVSDALLSSRTLDIQTSSVSHQQN